MKIIPGDLDDPRIRALEHHVTTARAATARGSAHGLDVGALKAPAIAFWAAWEADELLGVGALKRLSPDHGEIKSMHTLESARRRGVGRAMVLHIIETARAMGLARLSLETGSWAYFEPARALYRGAGFAECPPFGDYAADPNSVFLSLDLACDIVFRPLGGADLPLLQGWIRRPHVAQWWSDAEDFDDTRQKYLPRLQERSPVKPYIALFAGEPIGFIQSYMAIACGDGWWQDETDPGVHGVDQFLCDEARLGKGLGTRMVAAFVRRLFEDPRVTKVQADPHPDNVRAIRCYEKAGFRRVRNIVTPDGPALLMLIERSVP